MASNDASLVSRSRISVFENLEPLSRPTKAPSMLIWKKLYEKALLDVSYKHSHSHFRFSWKLISLSWSFSWSFSLREFFFLNNESVLTEENYSLEINDKESTIKNVSKHSNSDNDVNSLTWDSFKNYFLILFQNVIKHLYRVLGDRKTELSLPHHFSIRQIFRDNASTSS